MALRCAIHMQGRRTRGARASLPAWMRVKESTHRIFRCATNARNTVRRRCALCARRFNFTIPQLVVPLANRRIEQVRLSPRSQPKCRRGGGFDGLIQAHAQIYAAGAHLFAVSTGVCISGYLGQAPHAFATVPLCLPALSPTCRAVSGWSVAQDLWTARVRGVPQSTAKEANLTDKVLAQLEQGMVCLVLARSGMI